jgi:hypothetical protein
LVVLYTNTLKKLINENFIFTASQSGNSWFGIKKNNEETSDFILDDITIIEME